MSTITATCYFCEEALVCPPDGTMRECKCGMLSVDHTECYTQYVGSQPKERLDPDTEKQYRITKAISKVNRLVVSGPASNLPKQ